MTLMSLRNVCAKKSLWVSSVLLICALTAPVWAAEESSPDKIPELVDLDELRAAFNQQRGHVRLVALLSPSCGYCVKGYRYMRKILSEIDDPRLKMLTVWEPMLSGDTWSLASKVSRKGQDERMTYQAWDGGQLSGSAWQDRIGLGGVAWDVYFLYGPEAEWTEALPPQPASWLHQGAGGADDWLSYSKLKARLEGLLSKLP